MWIGVALGCILLVGIGYTQRSRFLWGHNDFAQLYAGARLSGTPQLYQPAASKKIHMEAFGFWLEGVYYSRPPFYAFLLRPLARLPYLAAYWLFQTISLGAFVWFLRTWTPRRPELLVFVSLCLPVLSNFLTGQDLAFPLLAFALSIEQMRRGRDFSAGLMLALCAIKIHLFVLVPVVLLIHRRWKVLCGGATGGAVLVTASFLSDGWNWPGRYLALLGNGELHPGPEHMPTLRGFVFAVTGFESQALLILLSTLTVLAMAWIAWRGNLEFGLAFALPAGLLIGYHAYLQDCMMMLMTFVLALEHAKWPVLRCGVALAITPPVFLFLLAGKPWNVFVPAALMICMILAAISLTKKPMPASHQ